MFRKPCAVASSCTGFAVGLTNKQLPRVHIFLRSLGSKYQQRLSELVPLGSSRASVTSSISPATMFNNYAPNRSAPMISNPSSSKFPSKPNSIQLMPANPYKGTGNWQKSPKLGPQSSTGYTKPNTSMRSDSSVFSVNVRGAERPIGVRNEMVAAEEDKKKKSDLETVRYLTGHIEKILKWHKLLNSFCHYEVIAPVISIQEGNVRMQQILLLRDKTGPVLKVIHYLHDRIVLSEFFLGQKIRCVGRMIGVNTLQAVNIREATSVEISALPRITYVCDQEISRFVNSNK